MKSLRNKTVVVKCLDWSDEFLIDPNIFDDIYMEAATRSLEKRNADDGFKVAVVIDCCEKRYIKKIDKHLMYITYFVLINAGLHHKAEVLRDNFKEMHGIDIKEESIKGSADDDGIE